MRPSVCAGPVLGWQHGPMSSRESREAIEVGMLIACLAAFQVLVSFTHKFAPHGSVAAVMLLGLPLAWMVLRSRRSIGPRLRMIMSAYLVCLVGMSIANAVLLLLAVMRDSSGNPIALLLSGFGVMAINMMSFGLIYWWLDAADPAIRAGGGEESPDFLFPQQMISGSTWRPRLVDYVYVAFTNLLAFSPTDTMPLRARTKVLFMVQSATSTFCAVVILGHAINALPDSG